jgi:hypothetical protein
MLIFSVLYDIFVVAFLGAFIRFTFLLNRRKMVRVDL